MTILLRHNPSYLFCSIVLSLALTGCDSDPDDIPNSAAGVPEPKQSTPDSPEAPPVITAPQAETPAVETDAEADAAALLEQQLAEFTVPPKWITTVNPPWDRSRPWKEARLEVRRLLGGGDLQSRREALRLMWDYREKNDFGNGHEYSMYTYLGKEPLWAILACREWLDREDHEYAPNFCIKSLASLYQERGMFREAEQVLLKGLNWPPEDPNWHRAEYHDCLGDLYVAWRRLDDARENYRSAIRLYPKSNLPYGQHLIPRRIKVLQSKLDVLSIDSLENASLRDGTWTATVSGYAEVDIHVTARVENGRLTVISLQHEEKIDQGATVLIPQRIVEQQTLAVDGITGATITKDAIVTGTLETLRKAGIP